MNKKKRYAAGALAKGEREAASTAKPGADQEALEGREDHSQGRQEAVMTTFQWLGERLMVPYASTDPCLAGPCSIVCTLLRHCL